MKSLGKGNCSQNILYKNNLFSILKSHTKEGASSSLHTAARTLRPHLLLSASRHAFTFSGFVVFQP